MGSSSVLSSITSDSMTAYPLHLLCSLLRSVIYLHISLSTSLLWVACKEHLPMKIQGTMHWEGKEITPLQNTYGNHVG